MKRSARLSLAAMAAALALVVGGSAAPAFADVWRYPGGVNCTSQNATTQTNTYGGYGNQHRAEGYGGYYYANWGATNSPTVRIKNWGWNSILSTRLGVQGAGTIIHAYVYCPA